MNTLTDRYVWAVLRCVPGSQRAELEPEVRALVADAIEARTAADPTLSPADAERAALIELGDPNALAARYTDARLYLIGPGVYPAWRAIIGVLLALVVPVVGVSVLAANLIAGSTVGEAIVAGGSTAFNAVIQMLFWFTLVFAVIERVGPRSEAAAGVMEAIDEVSAEVSAGLAGSGAARGGARGTAGGARRAWSVDDLPELPDDGRMSLGELAATLAVNALVLAGLVWVQLQPPIVIEGEAFPLFDPALGSLWLPWFIGALVLEIVFTIAVWMRGRWTTAYAIGNAILGAAFAIPAVYLLANDLLLNPALVEAINEATGGGWLRPTATITAIVIIAVVTWDAIDGFRKARRASEADRRGAAATAG
jgi:hypothetical protein